LVQSGKNEQATEKAKAIQARDAMRRRLDRMLLQIGLVLVIVAPGIEFFSPAGSSLARCVL
jgi:hypothetical protein